MDVTATVAGDAIPFQFSDLDQSLQCDILSQCDPATLGSLSLTSKHIRDLACGMVESVRSADGSLYHRSRKGLFNTAMYVFAEAINYVFQLTPRQLDVAMQSFRLLPIHAQHVEVKATQPEAFSDLCSTISKFLAVTRHMKDLRCTWRLPTTPDLATQFISRFPDTPYMHINMASWLPTSGTSQPQQPCQLPLRGLHELVLEQYSQQGTAAFDLSCLSQAQALTSLDLKKGPLLLEAFQCQQLRHLMCGPRGAPLQEIELQQSLAAQQLRRVILPPVRCTGSSLAALASLPSLQELWLDSLDIPAGSTAVLGALTYLVVYRTIEGTLASGQLAAVMPELLMLQLLALTSTAPLEAFGGHSKLRTVFLNPGPQMAWPSCLKNLHSLKFLNMFGLPSDSRPALQDIAACSSLTSLRLDLLPNDSSLSDDLVTALTEYLSFASTSLREVDIDNLTSQAHLVALLKGIPNLRKFSGHVPWLKGLSRAQAQQGLAQEGVQVVQQLGAAPLSRCMPAVRVYSSADVWRVKVKAGSNTSISLALVWDEPAAQQPAAQ